MLILGVVLGLVAGLLAGGRIENLVRVRLRWVGLLFLAASIRFGTEILLIRGDSLVDELRAPLLAAAYTLLLVALFANRRQPGIPMAFVGILGNAIAIVGNRGYMVVWQPSLEAAGFRSGESVSALHLTVPAPLDAYFLGHFAFLGDIIPIPLPFVQNVASIGDIFLSAGLAFFLFATVLREPAPSGAVGAAGTLAGATIVPPFGAPRTGETGVTPALAGIAALERPLVLGSTSAGLSGAAISPVVTTHETAAERDRRRALVPALLERARHHPYVHLALNPAFSALWTGQLISLFGDRMNQMALAFLVLTATGSPVAVGLVFLAATLPNLLLGPIAGTFVDRSDQKQVMVVSDLLRASLVLLIPIAAVTNIVLVYPLAFLVTSISIFFRPARTAVLPRIVGKDELLSANSAIWIADTLADVIGYPLAGLFVAFLGRALPLAFWFDAATYVASALLIATMAVPSVAEAMRSRLGEQRADANRATEADTPVAGHSPPGADTLAGGFPPAAGGVGVFFEEVRVGWRFLRGETVLLANTLQAVVGQFTVGVLLTLTPIYAGDVAGYAFLETGIGVGNLIGGLVIGLIGTRLAKGHMVISGYVLWGLCTTLLAVTGNLGIALGLMVGSGIANMVYVIPSQTLFQERTPANLIGRVVGFRISLVLGSASLGTAVAGVLAAQFGVPAVIGFFGLMTLGAGLAGLLVPAVRDA